MSFIKNISSNKQIPLILGMLMVFVMGLQKNYSPDVGFHLQSAQWMVDNKTIIKQDFFTYTSMGRNYFDMQWLYQFVLFFFNKFGGDKLLVVVNAILISTAVFIVWLRYKQEIGSKFNTALFVIVLLIAIQPLSFEIRPHVFSWIYLSVLLLILSNYKAGKTKQLVFIPLVMLLWVNSHSLSVLGLVVISIFVAGDYLERKKADKNLLKYGVASLLVFFINPYFTDGLLFPLEQFDILKGQAYQKLYIGELQTPFTFAEYKKEGLAYIFSPLLYMQIYSLAALWVGVRSLIKKEITSALLIAAMFFILAMAMKNYGYFFIATLPTVVKHYTLWLEKRNQKARANTNRLKWISICFPILISWLCITDGFSVLRKSPYRFGVSIDEQSLPVEATAFLNSNKIYGKLLNHLDFGGYMMNNYPEKVFIDGRLELPSQEFFKKYFNSLKPGGLESLLIEYKPDIIIFPYNKATGWWSYLISDKKNYHAVYFDGLAAIYLRNDKFKNIPQLTEENIRISSQENIYDVISIPKPSRYVGVLKSFFTKQYIPIEEQNKATFCFTYGFNNAALQYSAQGIRRATINPNNIFYNLNMYFQDKRKYNEAAICLKRAK